MSFFLVSLEFLAVVSAALFVWSTVFLLWDLLALGAIGLGRIVGNVHVEPGRETVGNDANRRESVEPPPRIELAAFAFPKSPSPVTRPSRPLPSPPRVPLRGYARGSTTSRRGTAVGWVRVGAIEWERLPRLVF